MGRHREILERICETAAEAVGRDDFSTDLPLELEACLRTIVSHSETNKAVVSVLATLLSHKLVNPQQDIRYHQAKMENGFAGRGIDTAEVTPFMKRESFPAMSESGWLTRSLEQPHPYDRSYPGEIRPKSVKNAFLTVVEYVQEQGGSPEACLCYLFKLLVRQRDSFRVELARPHRLSIARTVQLLEKHFTYRYTGSGTSRLPVLAIYAAYQCMMAEVARYEGKTLCPLASHNSADTQSGRIGDIDVVHANGAAFEGVEIKHQIPITRTLVADAYEKFKIFQTDRYYLLTTARMDSADWEGIDAEISQISLKHGCQVIVNGVYPTLKYYLRLLKDPDNFIDRYVELLKTDETVKFPHKEAWNRLIGDGF